MDDLTSKIEITEDDLPIIVAAKLIGGEMEYENVFTGKTSRGQMFNNNELLEIARYLFVYVETKRMEEEE